LISRFGLQGFFVIAVVHWPKLLILVLRLILMGELQMLLSSR